MGRRREEKKEGKRKREEWRRQYKEDRKRRKKEDKAAKSKESSASESEDEEAIVDKKQPAEPTEETKHRFMMWRALNNNGVTTARDVQRKYVGQVTDAALDARLREQSGASSSGKLMTEAEAEALAKLRK